MAVQEVYDAMLSNKKKQVIAAVQEALDQGIPAQQILQEGLLGAMDVVGRKFRDNEIYVPEVLVSARCMNAGVDLLKPYLSDENAVSLGKAVIGTVSGDMHDIGKNLCRMMMEGKGIEVIDLGVDVPAEKFIESARENNADIICLSSLLTTTMPAMKDTVAAIRDAGLKQPIMIGGAPITQAFCDEIGADAYTEDAASCAIRAAEFLQ